LSISNGIWKKTDMKSRNKIKMSSGNSTRCVGEVNENLLLRSTGTISTFWLRYSILIINAMRFCKLHTTTISNLLCLIVLTSGFTFNHLLGEHILNLSNLFFLGYISLMSLVEAQRLYFKTK